MRKNQINNPYKNRFTITCFGDSQTALDSAGYYGVAPWNSWGEKIAEKLRLSGCSVKSRVFGRGGDTTAHFLGRAWYLNLYDTPNVAIIYGGVNDPGSNVSAVAQNTSTANTITLANTSSPLANAYVGNVITLTSGTGSGQTKTIIKYNPSTFVATVDSNWSTNPNNTTNYTISAPTQAQMQANHQALIKVAKYNVKGDGNANTAVHVWSQTELPSNGKFGDRYIVMQDSSTTGGLHPNHPLMHNTILGNYSSAPKQSVWEFRVNLPGELGWGRVAIETTPAFYEGCSKVVTMGSNYLNWPSFGDNFNTTANTGTKYSTYVPVRDAAKAATLAEGTEYCDLYDFQSKLIYGGNFLGNTIYSETTQGSGTFHYVSNNQHHSTYGHDTVARALYYLFAFKGWDQILKVNE